MHRSVNECLLTDVHKESCVEALLEASLRIISRACKMKECRGIRLDYKEKYRRGHSYRLTEKKGLQRGSYSHRYRASIREFLQASAEK